jgi:hypothetical protein
MAQTIVLLLVVLGFFLPLAYSVLMTWIDGATEQSHH